jgi:hypothetical protein
MWRYNLNPLKLRKNKQQSSSKKISFLKFSVFRGHPFPFVQTNWKEQVLNWTFYWKTELRNVISKYAAAPLPSYPSNIVREGYGIVKLNKIFSLFEGLHLLSDPTNTVESENPLPMESIGQVHLLYHLISPAFKYCLSLHMASNTDTCCEFCYNYQMDGFILYISEYKQKKGNSTLSISKVNIWSFWSFPNLESFFSAYQNL